MSPTKPFFWILAAVIATFALLPWLTNDIGLREGLILSAIYIILASNLNLMIGYTGYVNFGNIVFFGLGGYIGIYLTLAAGVPMVLAAVISGAVVAGVAFLFGLGILRLRGAFFALSTIGIAEAVKAFVSNFEPWGGATGLYLARADFDTLGGRREAMWLIYFLIVAVMGASLYLSYYIKTSKFGLGLFAIREDEDAASVLGVKTPLYKSIIYSVSGFLPAVAGTLFFFKSGVIQPEQAFDLQLSIEAIVVLMLGGQGSITGAALGAFTYERFRSYLLVSPELSSFQMVIAGALLLVTVLFVPGGLMGWAYRRWPKLREIFE
ncbi:Branched-chain amino acid transport system permease protein LivM [uncultured Gammaproteobacteria bacterium]